ncbi:MAG: hypothetical protein AVDCRST_MAG31-601, partial [uncultured Sphingomonas sp.]
GIHPSARSLSRPHQLRVMRRRGSDRPGPGAPARLHPHRREGLCRVRLLRPTLRARRRPSRHARCGSDVM